jgi:hypothetical protein
MKFLYDSFKSKKVERSIEIDDEEAIADELSEVEQDTALTEMIASGAKSLEPKKRRDNEL